MVHIGVCLRHILVAALAAIMLAGFVPEAHAAQELLAGADGAHVQDTNEVPVFDCLFDPDCPLIEPAETTSGPAETSEGGGTGGGLTSPSGAVVGQTPSL
ncbi:MAG: hypothetical protein ACRD0K_16655 [Egibacteraceae bacterium]